MKELLRVGLGVLILIVFLILVAPYVDAGNITVTGLADENGDFSGEKVISVSDSGSKVLYGVDNLIGAKNKVITYDNKDKYVIDGYIAEDGTFYKGIYPNGEQNNMDKKECYINGTLSKQPRFYGKDCRVLNINYTVYLHDEITVVFNNTIGDRHNTITNNLGVSDTWSNNGKIFNNQISGLEFINTTDGNYTFSHWADETGAAVTNYFFEYVGNLTTTHIYTAIYDFVANPIPEPIDNETDDNTTNETDVDPTPEPQNDTDDNTTNETDVDPIPEIDNNTDNTTDTNTTDNNTTDDTNNTNIDIDDDGTIDYQLVGNNTITLSDFDEIDNTPETNTNTTNQTEEQASDLSEHETGISFRTFFASFIILLCFGLLFGSRRRE